jgi:hypothetical protein
MSIRNRNGSSSGTDCRVLHRGVGSVVVLDSTDYFEAAQPFGGAGGTRTGWGRIGGLSQLEHMTDLRTLIIGLD